MCWPQPSKAIPFAPSIGLRSLACEGNSAETDCGRLVLVQSRVAGARLTTHTLKIRLTAAYRISGSAVRRAIRGIGQSARSASVGARASVQRRIALSVCCRERIQSNLIAYDLPNKFPAARIERRVATIDRNGAPKRTRTRSQTDDPGLSDLIDFLVIDRDGPKLVFESCVETERKVVEVSPAETRLSEEYVVMKEADVLRRIEVTHAIKLKACVKWETGEISYARTQ